MKYDLDELDSAFENWIDTIVEILKVPMPKIDKAHNAGTVGGKTLDEIIEIVETMVNDHVSSYNPHDLNLEQIGALTREEIDRIFFYYQDRHNLPITIIENLKTKVNLDQDEGNLTIAGISPTILGGYLNIPETEVDLLEDDVQYLLLKIDNTVDGNTVSYEMSKVPTVEMNTIPVLKITLSSGTINGRAIVRIGSNELSTTPKGTTIPVTTGSQARENTIGNNWFT